MHNYKNEKVERLEFGGLHYGKNKAVNTSGSVQIFRVVYTLEYHFKWGCVIMTVKSEKCTCAGIRVTICFIREMQMVIVRVRIKRISALERNGSLHEKGYA